MCASATKTNQASTLRERLKRGPLIVPGTFFPFGVLQIQEADFEACYISGAALSSSLCLPDEGFVSREQVEWVVRNTVWAINIPLIVDCDTGLLPQWRVNQILKLRRRSEEGFIKLGLENPRYDMDSIIPTVKSMERAGAAAIHIEDQDWYWKRCGHLGGKRLISEEDMVKKVQMACLARKNPDTMIIARTDARSVAGFDEAVKRAAAYKKAGADAIFPEALESLDEFLRLRKALPDVLLVANLAEQGKTPPGICAENLSSSGYDIVLFPATGTRAMYKAHADALDIIKRTGSVLRLTEDREILTRETVSRLLRKHAGLRKK